MPLSASYKIICTFLLHANLLQFPMVAKKNIAMTNYGFNVKSSPELLLYQEQQQRISKENRAKNSHWKKHIRFQLFRWNVKQMNFTFYTSTENPIPLTIFRVIILKNKLQLFLLIFFKIPLKRKKIFTTCRRTNTHLANDHLESHAYTYMKKRIQI